MEREDNISLKLFWSFLKIGAFTFGGGYAMIPLIQNEVVNKRRWIAQERFLDLLTVAQSAPGPISLNTAVFVGYSKGGWRGAVMSIFGAILPSFVIIILIAIFFSDIKDNPVVAAIFKGIRPAVVALIAAPVIGLTKGMHTYKIGIAILAGVAVWKLGLSPIWFIILGAVAGIGWSMWHKQKKRNSSAVSIDRKKEIEWLIENEQKAESSEISSKADVESHKNIEP